MGNPAVTEAKAEIVEAHTLEREFIAGVRAINTAWVLLAEYAYRIHEVRGWERVGHETLNDFLAQPELGMKRRHFFRLVEMHRELVVKREVSASTLEGLDVTKVIEVLPAIRDGKVDVDTALDHVREMGHRDLRDEYGSSNGMSAEKVSCPTCGSKVDRNVVDG